MEDLTMLATVKKSFPGIWNDLFHYDALAKNETFKGTAPKVNVLETHDGFRVELAAPGLTKKDFTLNLDNDVLTISSDKEWKNNEQDDMIKCEFAYGSFSKSFILPESVDKEKIKANYQDGILSVEVPKLETAVHEGPRQIAVE
jgi:HSP20 family protein